MGQVKVIDIFTGLYILETVHDAVWRRLVTINDGHEVYEVYVSSSIWNHSLWSIDWMEMGPIVAIASVSQ